MTDEKAHEARSSEPRDELQTREILVRAQSGDRAALDDLIRRYRQPLLRLGHGRLPRGPRGGEDTEDIVQDTLLRALRRLGRIEPGGPGSLFAYLRKALENRIRDEYRRAARRPEFESIEDRRDLAAPGRSALEEVAEREQLEAYERALECLEPDQRRALWMRLELRMPHEDIAAALGSPSANAVRMQVARAADKVAHRMGEILGTGSSGARRDGAPS